MDGKISEKKIRCLTSVNRLLHQIDTTGSAYCERGSGRRRTAHTDYNVKLVEVVCLVKSQENVPGTNGAVRQIAR